MFFFSNTRLKDIRGFQGHIIHSSAEGAIQGRSMIAMMMWEDQVGQGDKECSALINDLIKTYLPRLSKSNLSHNNVRPVTKYNQCHPVSISS